MSHNVDSRSHARLLRRLPSVSPLLLLAGLALLVLLLAAGPAAAAPAAQSSTGPWQAWYWNNSSLSGTPVLYRTETAPGVDVGNGSPAPGVAVDFSAVWIGTVSAPTTGYYTFAARVDDGVRLWVDNRLILNAWQAGSARVVTGDAYLTAGLHTVRIEYFDERDTALLELEWGPQGTVDLADEVSPPPAAPGQGSSIGDDFMGGGPLATVGRQFSLNARTGPGVGYPIVTVIPGGTPVEMLYRWQAGLWIAVQIPDGRVGWVNATYLNADFATGTLPEWTGDPQAIASPSRAPAAPGSPGPAPAPPPAFGTGPLATMTGAYVLNVRTGPAVGYPVVTTISRGATVEMLYRWGPGLWVAVRTADGRVGWVNATYLSANYATGNLPEWGTDPQALATMP